MLGEYPVHTIVAVLYTEQQFRDITRAPQWSGGQYDGRIRIPVAGAAQKPELFERVMTHELTHAVIDGIVRRRGADLAQRGAGPVSSTARIPRAALNRMKAAGRSIPLKDLERGFGADGTRPTPGSRTTKASWPSASWPSGRGSGGPGC